MPRKKDPQLPRFSDLGCTALLCEAPPPLDIGWQRRIWAIAREAEKWPGVTEVMPGMNNLMVVFDPLAVEGEALKADIVALWPHCSWDGAAGKALDIEVVYGGEQGMDLDYVARHAGLSIEETVKLHAASLYTVYFLGAYPGLGYLGGLDPKLATPRRQEPRLLVPASSVAIGGAQAAVIPSESPSGWHVIGHAKEVFFDVTKEPPALLAPGDTIRFRIDRIER